MSAADDAKSRAVEVLREHTVECTGPGEVTCRGCRAKSWMSWPAFRAHQADYLAAAGLLADPDALARAKAEALREWIAEWPPTREGDFLASVARDGLARADRIDPTEPTVAELQAEAQRLCDEDRWIDPTEGNEHG